MKPTAEAKGHPLDKAFPPKINPQSEETNSLLDNILVELEETNQHLSTICKVLAIYAEANPPKARKKKDETK